MSQHNMQWSRVTKYTIVTSEGYLIRIQQVGDSWVYLVYTPSKKIQKKNDRVFYEGLEYKERYQKGEEIPPAYDYRSQSARRLLGGFHSSAYESASAALSAAKASCEQHRQHKNAKVLPGIAPNGQGDSRNIASGRCSGLPNTSDSVGDLLAAQGNRHG